MTNNQPSNRSNNPSIHNSTSYPPTQNPSGINAGLSGSQLPVQNVSGRSTNVQTGQQTPVEAPVFNDDYVNGELVR